MTRDRYAVDPLDVERLAWYARFKLRRVKARGDTGVLLSSIIRTPARGVSFRQPVVGISEGDTRLCLCSPQSKFPKFARLEPGEHDLSFIAVRTPTAGSGFQRRIELGEGDVFVAICWPIQPRTIFGRSSSEDHWYIGVV
jgi:hypothetical protein